MLPPFSKVSGSASFSKSHVRFLHPFSKVSGSAPFSKGHVSFFQKLINVCTSLKGMLLIGFLKFPFPRFASPSPMLPFSKGDSIVHQKIPWHFAETLLWSIPNVEALYILVPLSGSGE